jgi:hypothetical protein
MSGSSILHENFLEAIDGNTEYVPGPFIESQAFFHCAAATWFEDTVKGERRTLPEQSIWENTPGVALEMHYQGRITPPTSPIASSLAETSGRSSKSIHNETYPSQRIPFVPSQGILNLVEHEFGAAIWVIPSFEFSQGS